MPRYDYNCKDCKKAFFIICHISDSRDNVECEYCKSKNISRIYNAVILKHKKEDIKQDDEVLKCKNDDINISKNTHHHEHEYGSHCSPEDEYL